ncbi:MAG: GNAT family N-acetyltransferase [Deltaproteobacteria bacterium]|nr:GNAT family N-acetyltransferase [Deltaproteobacteria bacterium]
MQHSFRIATIDDHCDIVTMLNELVIELKVTEQFPHLAKRINEDIKLALQSANVCIFLLIIDNKPVGLARVDILSNDPIFRLREDSRCGYVDQMYVRPNFRNCGYGHLLLKKCEAWINEKGISHILLHAAPLALKFYEREGYSNNRELLKKIK